MHDAGHLFSCIQIFAYLEKKKNKDKNVIHSHKAFIVLGFTGSPLLPKFNLQPMNVIQMFSTTLCAQSLPL